MIILVLPAYNEELSLGPLLDKVVVVATAHPLKTIVVDDGSSDGTRALVQGYTDRLDLELVSHTRNLGLGAALRTGLETALTLGGEGDLVVTMDADDTHPPATIPLMEERLRQGNDVIIASRFVAGASVRGVSGPRRTLSKVAALLATHIVRAQGVRDFTCGYRAYSYSILERAHSRHGAKLIEESGFACMLELLIKLARLNARFAEVPLELRYDQKKGASKMRVFATVSASLRVLMRAFASR